MTKEQAIKIIENEIKCVDAECDIESNCGKCPYMMPSKEPIIMAYNMAIESLKSSMPIEEVKKMREEINDLPSTFLSTSFDYERGVNHMQNITLMVIDKYIDKFTEENGEC